MENSNGEKMEQYKEMWGGREWPDRSENTKKAILWPKIRGTENRTLGRILQYFGAGAGLNPALDKPCKSCSGKVQATGSSPALPSKCCIMAHVFSRIPIST